jgi:hypothetical protein
MTWSPLAVGLVAALALLAAPGAALADVIWEWNDATLQAVVAAKQLPYQQARTMALLNVAMFEAVNAVEPRYQPYLAQEGTASGDSAEAAAAAAGRAVLTGLFPDRKSDWDRLATVALDKVADPRARERGVAIGERAAAALLAHRAADGAAAPNAYRPVTPPGRYVPTALPVGSTWGRVTPWAMKASDQLRPAPPPALDGPTWRRDYDEVRAVGGKASAVRTASQAEAARFWIVTGPVAQWPLLRALAASPGRTLAQNARLLAVASMAIADAYIAIFDAKYAYLFWRPITAIRNGGGLHEPLAEEATWEPLIETPMHPEYPCAHCINAGAVAAVLEAEFGDGPLPGLEMTSASAPGVVHRWATVREWLDEVANARIWGGIHYRSSTEVGTAMGRRIGELATRRLPTRAAKAN